MAIIGVASVRVRPDLDKFKEELVAGLKKIDPKFTIKVGANTKVADAEIRRLVSKWDGKNVDVAVRPKIDKSATAEVDNFSKKLKKGLQETSTVMGNVVSGAISGTLAFTTMALKAGAIATALAGAAPIVGGIVSAVSAVGTAAVGVGLGALVVMGAAIGTIKLGIDGINKAFDALNPTVTKLRDAVSASFQSSLAPAVNNLKVILPQLKTGFQEIATAIGGAGTQFTIMLKKTENTALLKSILDTVARIIQGLSPAIASLGQAFLSVAQVATKVLLGLTGGIAQAASDMAARVSAAAKSGSLEATFTSAITKARQLFSVFKDVGSGIANIFRTISSSGTSGGFLDILTQGAQKFKEFTSSAAGTQIISTIVGIVKNLSGSFLKLLETLAPLLPLVGELAQLFADSLGQVLKELGPTLLELGKVLISTLKEILPKVTPFVIALAKGLGKILEAALPLLPPLADILLALVPLIDPLVKLAQVIIPPLADILSSLAPIIKAVAIALGFVIDAVATVIGGLSHLGPAFGALANGGVDQLVLAISGNAKKAEPPVIGLGQAIAGAFAGGFNGVLSKLPDQARDSINKLFHVFDKKDDFFSAGQAISTALGGGMNDKTSQLDIITKGLLTNIKNAFRGGTPWFWLAGADIANNVSDGLAGKSDALSLIAFSVVNKIMGIFRGGAPDAQNAGFTFAEALSLGLKSGSWSPFSASSGIVASIHNIFSGGAPTAQNDGFTLAEALSLGLKSGSWSPFSSAHSIGDTIRSIWQGLRSGATADGRSLVAAFADGMDGARGRLSGAAQTLGDVVRLTLSGVSLYGAGVNIVASLEAGIRAREGTLRRLLQDLSAMIPQVKGPPAKDRVMLTPAGIAIMDGLISGIKSKQDELNTTLQGVTSQFDTAFSAPSINSSIASSLDVSGTLTPTPVIVNVSTDEGVLKGFIQVQIDDKARSTRRAVKAGIQP